MTITTQLPNLDLKELKTLLENATRLQHEPGKRAAQAVELIPLIEAEIAARPTATAAKAKPRAKKATA